MKPKIIIPLLVFMGSTLCSNCQQGKGKITGSVKDSAQKGLGFANLALYKSSNLQQAIKLSYTSADGKFTIANLDTGSYNLIVTHTGFSDKQVKMLVSRENVNQQLPDIILLATEKLLQDVTVTSRKQLVEQLDDKIIYNVENDPTAKTETAIDILRKTPFVTVDGDGNVQVNGQSNFKVLLNGKETAMFAQNVNEALKGFPGSIIVKIEVITNPSAKYDAEGVGGIINIITKKRVKGYNGSMGGYYSNTGWYNGNVNLSAKFGKFGVTLSGFASGVHDQKNVYDKVTTAFTPSAFTRRTLHGPGVVNYLGTFENAELSYEFDSLNAISAYANLSHGKNRTRQDETITTEFASQPPMISGYNVQSVNEFPSNGIGTDYIRKFSGKKDEEFDIRLYGEFGGTNAYINSQQTNPDRFIMNTSVAKNTQYTAEMDYILPLKNSQQIEAGMKGIFRDATSDYESLIKYAVPENYKLNPLNTDHFNYAQDVYSAYGTYSFKVHAVGFRFGARLEHTEVNGNFISSNSVVKQSYTNVIPNLQATIKLSSLYTVVLSYSDRLQRPFIWNLNPFVSNNDSLNISFGNPDLKAQVIHSVSIQTRLSKGQTFAGLTLMGSYSGNSISSYASFDPSTGVTSTTYENLGREIRGNLNANVSTKFNNNWSMSVNGSLVYNHIKNILNTAQTNQGLGGNGNINSSYVITKKITVNGYFGFWRAPVTIQGKQSFNGWYGTGASYKFYHDKLSASLSAANFLLGRRDYWFKVIDPYFETINSTNIPYRAIALNITWNFGKLKENVSKKKGVNNDDLIGNGQSSN